MICLMLSHENRLFLHLEYYKIKEGNPFPIKGISPTTNNNDCGRTPIVVNLLFQDSRLTHSYSELRTQTSIFVLYLGISAIYYLQYF
nr:MAG TPA: hypothetical protein [Caudoviricetes sp.]